MAVAVLLRAARQRGRPASSSSPARARAGSPGRQTVATVQRHTPLRSPGAGCSVPAATPVPVRQPPPAPPFSPSRVRAAEQTGVIALARAILGAVAGSLCGAWI